MNDDTFTLSPTPAPIRGKRQICDNNAAARQTVLFAGLACLPGQNDLFPTDGAAGNDEVRMTNDEEEEPAEFGAGITREDAEDPPERYCSHCFALLGPIVETIGENRYHPACWEKVAFGNQAGEPLLAADGEADYQEWALRRLTIRQLREIWSSQPRHTYVANIEPKTKAEWIRSILSLQEEFAEVNRG